MAKHRLLALTNPVEGQEEELNRWYDGQHLSDVLAVPGVVNAQRFRVAAGFEGPLQWRYLTLYELETDNPAEVLQELSRRVGTTAMPMTAALDSGTAGAVILDAIGSLVTRASQA